MNDTLIINGITYKAVKEEKKPERLEGWINSAQLLIDRQAYLTKERSSSLDNSRMVELRSGEIIISERDVRRAWNSRDEWDDSCDNPYEKFIKELGFKKDGAV